MNGDLAATTHTSNVAPPYERPVESVDSKFVKAGVTWLVTRSWLHTFLRKFFPILDLCLLRMTLVTRYDDATEVLSRHDVFHVPFAKEMARLNDGEAPGTPFILGIDNQRQHDTQLKQVMSVFLRSDVEKLVAIPSYEFAQVRLAKAGDGQLDAVRELITAVPLEICKWYFGVNVDIDLDRQKFADAAMDVSGHLFGKPPVDPIDEVDRAADYVRWVVDQSIDKALSAQTRADNILTRLVEMKFDRKTIRAFLMGMIVGFVPTNTMAGGHILEMLLSRREYMERSQAAAKAGDDDLLRHCLFETLRFMPINPGPFRLCSRDYEIAAGTPRAKVVRRDRTVFVMDMSAMADPEQVDNPKIFDPSRPASNYLNFGFGMHWCAGAFIAQAQITQTFKPLLRARKVERVDGSRGELQRRAGFPDHLFVSFKEV